MVHHSQRGFVGGRRMGDKILLTLAAMEKALILGEHSFGTTLFDTSAAFPSVSWEWLRAMLDALRLPDWVIKAVCGLMIGSMATIYINSALFPFASVPVQRGIRQGCPSSGSVWALLFDPVVQRLIAAPPSPHDSLTCFADDLAASLIKLGAGLRSLLPVFLEVSARW